jgi:hypothetical protein
MRRIDPIGRAQASGEKGQAIVLVALGMLVLLGITSLIIDVGAAYAHRRNMQNAADAATTAAARLIALEGNDLADSDIRATINTYVTLNGGNVDYANNPPYYIDASGDAITPVGQGGSIPTNARGVALRAEVELETFFASLLGHPLVDVQAQSAAQAYQAQIPSHLPGIVPLTVPQSAVDARDTLFVWGSHYGSHYGTPSEFKGILDFGSGSGPGYEPGAPCGNKKDCAVKWITYGFDGSIGLDNWIHQYNGELGNNVRSPLKKRLYDQGLSDEGGAYGYIIVPVWDEYEDGQLHICGFAQVKMYVDQVGSNQAPCEFVSFVVPEALVDETKWEDIGPKVVKLVPPTGLPTPVSTTAATVTATATATPVSATTATIPAPADTPTPTSTPTPTATPCPSPMISGVSFSPVGNSGKVDVSWATDIPGDSLVEWGTSPGNYTGVRSSAGLTKSHQLQIDGIAKATQYYYRITSTSSCDAEANVTGTFSR